MEYAMTYGEVASQAMPAERATFIRKTYGHLALAILAFVAVEAALLQLPIGERIMQMLAVSQWSWLVVLGGFMVVSWVANAWAHSNVSRPLQYAGLGLYIVAEAIIFLPLLYIASNYFANQYVIEKAGIMTLTIFGGLSICVFTTKKDFSFLGPVLSIAGLGAMGCIVAGIFFGFNLGLWFSVAMIAFASGAIIYSTSNVLHRYRTDQYVAASLALFAAVALLFYYLVMFFIQSSRD